MKTQSQANQNPKAHAANITAADTVTEAVPEIRAVTGLDDIPDGYDIADGGDVVYVVRLD